nr:TniQ family protein [Microbacterium sp.]
MNQRTLLVASHVGPTERRRSFERITFKERPHREVLNWRAWLPLKFKNRPVSGVCPVCVESTTDWALTFPLIVQLPITLTCPRHGCRLDSFAPGRSRRG